MSTKKDQATLHVVGEIIEFEILSIGVTACVFPTTFLIT